MILTNLALLSLPHDTMVKRLAALMLRDHAATLTRNPSRRRRRMAYGDTPEKKERDPAIPKIREILRDTYGFDGKTLRLARELAAEMRRQAEVQRSRREARGFCDGNPIDATVNMLGSVTNRLSDRYRNITHAKYSKLWSWLADREGLPYSFPRGQDAMRGRYDPVTRCARFGDYLIECQVDRYLVTQCRVVNADTHTDHKAVIDIAIGRMTRRHNVRFKDHMVLVGDRVLSPVEVVAAVSNREVTCITGSQVTSWSVAR